MPLSEEELTALEKDAARLSGICDCRACQRRKELRPLLAELRQLRSDNAHHRETEAAMAETCARLPTTIAESVAALEKIVEIGGIDQGVVLLSNDGPTHYDKELKVQVYDHENFSQLGDALVALHEKLTAATPKGTPP